MADYYNAPAMRRMTTRILWHVEKGGRMLSANRGNRAGRFVHANSLELLRRIRVCWVQQLAIDRALLAAMRTLRRESRDERAATLQRQRASHEQLGAETARMRKELAGPTADVRALRERIGATTSVAPPHLQTKARTDGDPDPRRDE